MDSKIPDTCPRCDKESIVIVGSTLEPYQDHFVATLRIGCYECGYGARYEAEIYSDWRMVIETAETQS